MITQRLQQVCAPGPNGPSRIALDTNCLEYYLSDRKPWADCLEPVFQAIERGHAQLFISTVALSELLAHHYFANRSDAGYDPELAFMATLRRHCEAFVPVCETIANHADHLRGTYAPGDKIKLKTPDALIGATSLAEDHDLVISNDRELCNALPSDRCLYLKTLALEWLAAEFPGRCYADSSPVPLRKRGAGLPGNPAPVSLELGSIQPAARVKWDRILGDAINIAATINEPCIFFVLTARTGRRTETREVLFWHKEMADLRPAKRIISRLIEHIGYSSRIRKAGNANHAIHVFAASSLARARSRQSQPCYQDRSDHAKETEAWCDYLNILRQFQDVLSLPQTTCLLCEDGEARILDAAKTAAYLKKAGVVLGWEGWS